MTLTEAEFNARQAGRKPPRAPGSSPTKARPAGGRATRRVHQLMAAHSMVKIETVYGTVFENILGEKISTKPVDVVTPFPWVDRDGNQVRR